jgi:FAD/FMN-containing dehydrogenase
VNRPMPHRVHTHPARPEPGPAVAITTDADVVGTFLEDAARFPGGHAPGVAHPRSEGDVAALVREIHPLLPVWAQSSLTGRATPMGETVVATDHLDRVLGVVTEVSFIVMPRRPDLELVWILTPDERQALDLVSTLRQEAQTTWRTRDPRGIDVAGVEHLDRRSLEILREDGADRTHDVPLPVDAAVALLAQIELPDDAVPSKEDAYGQIVNALSARAPDTPLVRLCRLVAGAGLLDRTEIALPGNQRRQAQLLAIREAVPEAVNRRIGAAQQTSPTIQKTAADMIVRFEQFEECL